MNIFIALQSKRISLCLWVLQMFPSSEMAEGVVDKKLAEPHVRLLISLLPGVLPSITEDWAVWLLQVQSTCRNVPMCLCLFIFILIS